MRRDIKKAKKEKMLAVLFVSALIMPCFVMVAIALVGRVDFALASPGEEIRWNISHESGYAGEYVDVRIPTAENANSGWGNLQFFISYDPSILELVSPMVIEYHDLGYVDGFPVLVPMSISRVAWGNYEFFTETLTENVMIDETVFDDVTFQTLISQPEPLRRNLTLTNHGNYQEDGSTTGIQFGAFDPTNPVVGKGYLFIFYQIPPENMTIHEPIIGTDFETVLRFRISENAPAGTVTPIFWEGVDANFWNVRIPFAFANPEDHGSVTVLGDVARTYTITYLPGTHGVGTGGVISDIAYNNVHMILPPDAVYISPQPGYRFVGWVDENGTIYSINDSITVTEGMTLTAVWEIDDEPGFITITFIGNGGVPESQRVTVPLDATYADAIRLATQPSRDGYTFKGWFFTAQPGGSAVNETDSVAAGPRQLYAHWTLIPPELPLTQVHHAYLFGYGDYTIRPNRNISRAEVATIFFRLITDEHRAEVWNKSNPYSDVASENWFNNSISTMTNAGLFNGLPDGTFAPNRPMTRGELAAVAARLSSYDISLPGDITRFNDTSGHWAEAEINLIADFNWVEGFGDGSFRPDDLITRAQVAAIINRMLGRVVESSDHLLDGMRTWHDNIDPSDWHYLHIQLASNSADYVNIEDSNYIRWTTVWQPLDFTILEREDSEHWHIITAREDWEALR